MASGDQPALDVFISYSSADNDLPPPYGHWVTRFESSLRKTLKYLLKREPQIYFDQKSARPNHVWDRILDSCRSSRIFLALASPAFHAGEWPRREVRAFIETEPEPERLFVAELEYASKDDYHPALWERTNLRFYGSSDQGLSALPLFAPDSQEFTRAIWKLARAVKEQLDRMEARQSTPAIAEAARLGPVLLAMATDDLEKERESVRAYFEQVGIRVYPDHEYPLGGDAFAAALAEDLARCAMMVQLLGPLPGRRPRDLPQGYCRFQAVKAAEAGKPVMQWRSTALKIEDVTDPDHKALLLGDTVVASTLEQFKQEVRRRLETPPPKPCAPNPHFVVFVNAEKSDEPAARRMKEALEKTCSVMLPLYTAEGSIQDEYRENIQKCDALLLVYGQAGPSWIRNQMMFVAKTLRGAIPRGAICLGPPPEKPHVNFSIPGIREIDCRTVDGVSWRIEPVQDLVAQLQ